MAQAAPVQTVAPKKKKAKGKKGKKKETSKSNVESPAPTSDGQYFYL